MIILKKNTVQIATALARLIYWGKVWLHGIEKDVF